MIYPILVVVPVLACIAAITIGFRRRKEFNVDMKLVLLFLTAGLVNGVVSILMASFGQNNLILWHIYTLVEFSIVIAVLSFWQRDELLQRALHYLIPVYFLFWLFCKLFVEDLTQFDTFSATISRTILAVVALYTIYLQVEESIPYLFRSAKFWISFAVFLYCSTNVVLAALGNVIVESNQSQLHVIWNIHYATDIVAYAFYIRGFLCPILPQTSLYHI